MDDREGGVSGPLLWCKQRVRPVPVLGVLERLAGDEETVSKRASLRLDALGRMRLPS